MRLLISLTITTVVIINHIHSLPVPKEAKKDDHKHEEKDSNELNIENVIEYERYLKEVVNALESDSEFREKLDKASEVDIRTGKIAHELEYVNHNVRTKLDEIKRQELERLRSLATKQFELTNDIDRQHLKIDENDHHVDHNNQHTFEIEDLKKLILKTSADLAEADRRRREEFKEYELQKEFEKQENLKSMDDEHKKQYEKELKEQQAKHDKHEKLHHPGNKAQLEEVWEKQDHMDAQDFNPQTFFMLHDLDGNNFWDENEVKALFVKELDKMYQSGMPEDDMRERAEEMERMREHVFKEADTNHDNLISYEEFIEQTKREEFKKDQDWETVDHQQQFTHEEYLEFERRRHEEIQRLVAEGKLPPHPNMPGGYYPDNGQYQVPQQQYHQGQGHPNAIPVGQQYPQAVNYHPNQVYEHVGQAPQHQYQQPPPQQHYQQQQQQQHYQQPPPQQQYHPAPSHQQPQYQPPVNQQQQYQPPPPPQQQQHQPVAQQQQQQQQNVPPPPPQQQQQQNVPPPQQQQQHPAAQQQQQQAPVVQQHAQVPPQQQQAPVPQQAQQNQPLVNNNQQPPVQQQQQPQIKSNNIPPAPASGNQIPQNAKSETHSKA